MNKNRKPKEGVVVQLKRDPYSPALKEFIQMTNSDASFFNLSPEEQKKIAMGYIEKQKDSISGKEK